MKLKFGVKSWILQLQSTLNFKVFVWFSDLKPKFGPPKISTKERKVKKLEKNHISVKMNSDNWKLIGLKNEEYVVEK